MNALDSSYGRGKKFNWPVPVNTTNESDGLLDSKSDRRDFLQQVKVQVPFNLLSSDVSSLAAATSRQPPAPTANNQSPGNSARDDEDEDDCCNDYEDVSSPGSSSTASGPIYIRKPGFQHYALEIHGQRPKLKKQKLNLVAIHTHRDNAIRRREPTPPKARTRRDPLPMRYRALPQSFFQQPNKPQNIEPTANYPVLPPLFQNDTTDVRPVTPPDEREKRQQMTPRTLPDRITVTNAELLNKLFEHVENDKNRGNNKTVSYGAMKKSRPPKHVIISTNNKSLLSGHDPCLVEAISEKLFPQLGLDKSKNGGGAALLSSTATVQLVTMREGERTFTLPSLTVEQNLPHMLNELVTHI